MLGGQGEKALVCQGIMVGRALLFGIAYPGTEGDFSFLARGEVEQEGDFIRFSIPIRVIHLSHAGPSIAGLKKKKARRFKALPFFKQQWNMHDLSFPRDACSVAEKKLKRIIVSKKQRSRNYEKEDQAGS